MLSSRFSSMIARTTRMFLTHTCTITTSVSTVPPTSDENGNPIYDSVRLEDVPCLFLWRDTELTDERGIALRRTPQLYLKDSECASEGDIVENVRDRREALLLTSAKIGSIDTTAEGGSAALKSCELEGVRI